MLFLKMEEYMTSIPDYKPPVPPIQPQNQASDLADKKKKGKEQESEPAPTQQGSNPSATAKIADAQTKAALQQKEVHAEYEQMTKRDLKVRTADNGSVSFIDTFPSDAPTPANFQQRLNPFGTPIGTPLRTPFPSNSPSSGGSSIVSHQSSPSTPSADALNAKDDTPLNISPQSPPDKPATDALNAKDDDTTVPPALPSL